MQPISQDQWQIAKFILEFKSALPTGILFDGIRFGWIFLLLKDLFHNVGEQCHGRARHMGQLPTQDLQPSRDSKPLVKQIQNTKGSQKLRKK